MNENINFLLISINERWKRLDQRLIISSKTFFTPKKETDFEKIKIYSRHEEVFYN